MDHKVTPLEVPLRTLAPNRLVWIQRGGLVYPYPARIVRDIANDLYVAVDYWSPERIDINRGDAMDDAFYRGTNRASFEALASGVWRASGGDSSLFQTWWDSIAYTAAVASTGAAASYAARNVLTWSLFKHRYMIDTPSQSL